MMIDSAVIADSDIGMNDNPECVMFQDNSLANECLGGQQCPVEEEIGDFGKLG
jgi:hypothetical protein